MSSSWAVPVLLICFAYKIAAAACVCPLLAGALHLSAHSLCHCICVVAFDHYLDQRAPGGVPMLCCSIPVPCLAQQVKLYGEL